MAEPIFICMSDYTPGARSACPDVLHDWPLPSGYVASGEVARARLARGWKSKKCPKCGLYGWVEGRPTTMGETRVPAGVRVVTDHLVILRKKWLTRILDGVKPVEFRAGRDRRAPWGRVAAGDRLWLKESGGPVRGVAYAGVPLCAPGRVAIWAAQAACGAQWATSIDLAWAERLADARYATLVPLERIERLTKPLDASDIRGRRQDAWQVLDPEDAGLLWTRYFDALTGNDEAAA